MEDTITLTAEELNEKIKEAVEKAVEEITEKLNSSHSEEMARQRQKAKDELDRKVKEAVANANLSAEERTRKEFEEQAKADKEELEKLRLEKRISERGKKLTDNGLPEFLKHDSRLVNADDEKVDEIVGIIKKEYESALPEGARSSTDVHGSQTSAKDKFASFRKEGIAK